MECKRCVYFNTGSAAYGDYRSFRELLLFGRELCAVSNLIGNNVSGQSCKMFKSRTCGERENIRQMCQRPARSQCPSWKLSDDALKSIKSRNFQYESTEFKNSRANSSKLKITSLEAENADLKRQLESAAEQLRETREKHREFSLDRNFFMISVSLSTLLGILIALLIWTLDISIITGDFAVSWADTISYAEKYPDSIWIVGIGSIASIIASILLSLKMFLKVRIVPGPGMFAFRNPVCKDCSLKDTVKRAENNVKDMKKSLKGAILKEDQLDTRFMKCEHSLSDHDETPVKNTFTFSIESKKRMHPINLVVGLRDNIFDD